MGVQTMKTARQPSPLSASDRIASLREAAAIRGVSIDTLRRMGARGEIEILQLSPRRRGVRLSQVIPSPNSPHECVSR
jgi:hypothetical protein